jgi:hypothetical protein
MNAGKKEEIEKKDDHDFPSDVGHALKLANSQKLTDKQGNPFSILLNMEKLTNDCPSCAIYFQLARYLFILLLFFMIVFSGAVAGVSYYTCTKENLKNEQNIF